MYRFQVVQIQVMFSIGADIAISDHNTPEGSLSDHDTPEGTLLMGMVRCICS